MKKIGAIVLAAGKGRRVGSKDANKVVLKLGNKEMILHTIEVLKKLPIDIIVVVVGFAKKSVMDVLGKEVIYVEQKTQLGTAHAVNCALRKVGQDISDVLVLNGDDSAFYKKETIADLIKKHNKSGTSISFLTIELGNPSGLGRVIRDSLGKVLAIVEERDASAKQKRIKEINPACYIFDLGFLYKYLGKIKKSQISGEYYLTSLVDMAIENNEKIETVKGGKILWRGINTQEELKEAERLFLQAK